MSSQARLLFASVWGVVVFGFAGLWELDQRGSHSGDDGYWIAFGWCSGMVVTYIALALVSFVTQDRRSQLKWLRFFALVAGFNCLLVAFLALDSLAFAALALAVVGMPLALILSAMRRVPTLG